MLHYIFVSRTEIFACVSAGIIAKAQGIAVLTVVKASFWFSVRGGSGIVIAKLKHDSK